MSTMTHIRADGILEELVEDAQREGFTAAVFRHEDGSVTVVNYDEYGDEYSPREDGTLAKLVSDSSDYLPLDDPDAGIWEARERWDHLGDDRCEGMVGRYIAMFRPDIAAYLHHWQVVGSSQSDWRSGWAYMTREALAEAGYSMDPDRPLNGTLKMRARTILDAELAEYRAWFAEEVFYASHIAPAGPEYAIGDAGGYYTGRTLGTVETVHGFIGYDSLDYITESFTDSPVVERLV